MANLYSRGNDMAFDEDQGITAYHGSPHEFERFDLSKIGTGEGAQAYGHGLYFAESEPIAKGYRDALSADQPIPIKVGEERHYPYTPMQRMVAEHRGDVDAVIKKMNPKWEKIEAAYNVSDPNSDDMDKLLNQLDYEEAKKQRAEVESMRGKNVEYGQKGHMYEVRINAHPDHFLDWDKPFDEQSEYVKNALRNSKDKYLDDELKQIQSLYGRKNSNFGAGFYEFLQSENKAVKNEKGASDWLRKNGIKGIKYLDAGSRGKGDGTRNYVVFDDKLVNVKRRYERGGMVEPEKFEQAFANARSSKQDKFHWTNPETGEKALYTTQLARKDGGKIPSISDHDQWRINEDGDQDQKPRYRTKMRPKSADMSIVSRAVMLSSRKS